jgi:demethylmenaquinone methyltransferase/2-methoxy-6-polyprenyl-1,4-benzoquinol methylase
MQQNKRNQIQAMFGRIAPRYDRMNRLMTFGRDQAWRRLVVQQARISNESNVLDIAAGTGDIAFEIRRQFPEARIVAADFALPMMQVGKKRESGQLVDWSAADALHLPFRDASFNAVVSGFLFRNVLDIEHALSEQFRILQMGGRIVSLDTSPPPDNLLRPFTNFYLRRVIPVVGRVITGDSDAYQYLPESTLAFKTPQALTALMLDAGFVDVGYRRLMMGTIAVCWGSKPR